MSILASTRPRASLSAFRDAGFLLHARQYAAKAKGNSVKQHSKWLANTISVSAYIETERHRTRSAQGFREEKSQKVTKKQQRMGGYAK